MLAASGGLAAMAAGGRLDVPDTVRLAIGQRLRVRRADLFTADYRGVLRSIDRLTRLATSGAPLYDVALVEVARDVARFFGRDLPGAVYRTGPIPQLRRRDEVTP